MIKFGVAMTSMSPQHTLRGDYCSIKKVVLTAEKLGFDSIWLNDHLITKPPSLTPFLECWTTLSALAAETNKIRLGTLATCASFRYPSLLAKITATFDVISKGRLDMGIGAGWYESEYIAYGIPYFKAAERIAQLEEAVNILKMMWTEEKSTFHGKYYRISDAVCSPKPIQKPHPPLWVCGGGEKFTLKVVAKFGDGCNFFNCTPEEYASKLQVLKKHCTKVNRKLEDIQKSVLINVFIANNEKQAKKKALLYKTLDPSKEIQEMHFEDFINRNIVGTPDQCIKIIRRYIDSGVTYFMLNFTDASELIPLRIFATHVIPACKA